MPHFWYLQLSGISIVVFIFSLTVLCNILSGTYCLAIQTFLWNPHESVSDTTALYTFYPCKTSTLCMMPISAASLCNSHDPFDHVLCCSIWVCVGLHLGKHFPLQPEQDTLRLSLYMKDEHFYLWFCKGQGFADFWNALKLFIPFWCKVLGLFLRIIFEKSSSSLPQLCKWALLNEPAHFSRGVFVLI